MKKLMSLCMGLALLAGAGAVFAQAPAQTDQPKAEKSKKKASKRKSSGGGEGRKTEEPKAQKK